MIDITKLNSQYSVRTLKESDIDDILEIYKEHKLFHQYSNRLPYREEILKDMYITPPKTDAKQKYYIGFYRGDELIAIMDLIDGYPSSEIAYIGLFMVKASIQGKQIGSSIIKEALDYLKTINKTAARLAINKGNPQSTHFWKKNGFIILKEVENDEGTFLVAQKIL